MTTENIERFTSLKELKEKYYTLEDVIEYLKEHNYAASNTSFKAWEKKGLLPETKRAYFRGRKWRVFSKDGSDFEAILQSIKKRSKIFVHVI